MIDDPCVELIPGQPHACITQRLGGLGRSRLEPQNREVTRAAAKVTHQHRCRMIEAMSKLPSGGFRFEHDGNLGETGFGKAGAQPGLAEIVIGIVTDKTYGPSDRHGAVLWRQLCQLHQFLKEGGDQRFQRNALTEKLGLPETCLRQIGLHRHDEPRFGRIVEIRLNGLFSHGAFGQTSSARQFLPQRQKRAACVRRVSSRCWKAHGTRVAVLVP